MTEPHTAAESKSESADRVPEPIGDANGTEANIGDAATGTPAKRSMGLFIGAFAVGVLWWASLACLAAFTSNPPTLNYQQFSVKNSQAVVIGTVEEFEKGTFNVESAEFGRVKPGEITITNLSQSSGKAGEKLIVPLRRTPSGAWEIVPTPLPKNNLIVYPVNENTQAQFEAIKEWRGRF